MRVWFRILLVVVLMMAVEASAFQPPTTESTFDPSIMKINEDNFLGKTVPEISMVDSEGRALSMSGFLGKPLVISLIYYKCVASCPVLNEGLSEALSDINLRLAEDYNVLTLSFRESETVEDASQFKKKLQIKMKDKIPANFDKWVFATSTKDDIKKFTDALGYRFFYSTQDSVYVHPNVYIFISPKGKITRYLFGLFPISDDIKIALIEAADGKIGKSDIINAFTLACFKYDAHLGGYKLNLPFIVGMISIAIAMVTAVIVFLYALKLKKQKKGVDKKHNLEVTNV